MLAGGERGQGHTPAAPALAPLFEEATKALQASVSKQKKQQQAVHRGTLAALHVKK